MKFNKWTLGLAAVGVVLAHRARRALAVRIPGGLGAGVGRQKAEPLAVEVPATRLHDAEENGEREDHVGRRRDCTRQSSAVRPVP